MNDDPFLPRSLKDAADRFAVRLGESLEVISNSPESARFPEWVRMMIGSAADQVFSRETSLAFKKADQDFFHGFTVGALLAIHHILQSPSPSRLEVGQLVASAAAAHRGESNPQELTAQLTSVPPFEIPDVLDFTSAFLKELASKPADARARVLEGVIEGSAIELMLDSGGMRIGTAFDVQFTMLMFTGFQSTYSTSAGVPPSISAASIRERACFLAPSDGNDFALLKGSTSHLERTIRYNTANVA